MDDRAKFFMMAPLLIIAIAIAFTLPKWAAILQTAVCAFSLGIKFVKMMDTRGRRTD